MPSSQLYPGQAVVEYELVVPNNRTLVLSNGIFNHVSTTTIESIYGVCEYKHRVLTTTVDFADKLLKQAMASGTPRLRFRFGVGTPDKMFWLPWQEHVIVGWSGVLESAGDQAGHALDIVTQDYLYLLGRGNIAQAHRGSISTILRTMGNDHGFVAQVIEDTVGEGIYIQTPGCYDVDFVRNRLIPRALNRRNRGNYAFYFKDNAMHFHSPDFQAEVHDVLYYQANSASVVFRDQSQEMLPYGVANTVVVAYNPYTGETKTLQSRSQNALKMASSIYNLAAVPDAQRVIRYHTSGNRPEEAEAISQNVYEHARSKTFALNLNVEKMIDIRHGDIVNLVIAPADNKSSPWSGFYLAAEVRHDISKGAVMSSYTLVRGEIGASLANISSTTRQDALVSDLEAPGQSLNVPEIKSSQRTKGAGKISVNGKLYSTVLDPNKR
jgi:hypothetical protein